MFYGREELLSDLDALWGKRVSSLVTCRGRRRIGKSTLIEYFAQKSEARFIKIEGLRPQKGFTNEDELRSFAMQLAGQSNAEGSVPENWLSAFIRLSREISDEGRTVVLLDEVSWMAYYDPTFAGTLKMAWDNHFKKHNRLILVVCGSVSTWIKENIVDDGQFLGRRSLDVVVPELPLRECARFWDPVRDRIAPREIIELLSVTGGVPRYLEEVNPSLSVAENIRRLCFRPRAPLRTDFDEMFNDVITRQTKATAKILACLVDGSRTVTEIAALLDSTKGGHISESLAQLEEAGFVYSDVGTNPQTGAEIREKRYRLRDNYSRFYLKYIRPAAKLIDREGFAFSGMDQFRGWESIMGLQFENLVVNHFQELLPYLHLENSLVYSAAPYRNGGRKGEGVQIDLLLQTKRSAYVVEVKRCAEIGQEVVDDVARKVRRLKVAPGNSIRSALVYDGHLSRTVEADGFFDAIIPFRRLLGI